MSAATSLLSLVLTLRPLDFRRPAETLPHWWGRAAHALLLDTVRRADAALAKACMMTTLSNPSPPPI